MNNVQNKTVLITGAASGIGFNTVEELLRNGAKSVAILDLPNSNGKNAVASLENEYGKGKAIFFPCDVTNAADLEDAFKKTVDAFNGLDIVINNAGILDDTRWERTIDLNVTALIRGSLLAINAMGKHNGGNGGTIVNLASIVGLRPISSLMVYSASKHAVIGFNRSLQDAYDRTGVRILAMCPGVTVTSLFGPDPRTKLLDFVDAERARENLKTYPTQSVDHVGRGIVQLIQKGKNGAIWVVEGSQPPYAVKIPHYKELAEPIED